MSGACREGFDLFSKFGMINFLNRFWREKRKQHGCWHYVWLDTFGKYVCRLFGHSKKRFKTDDAPPMTVCCRCFEVTEGYINCYMDQI